MISSKFLRYSIKVVKYYVWEYLLYFLTLVLSEILLKSIVTRNNVQKYFQWVFIIDENKTYKVKKTNLSLSICLYLVLLIYFYIYKHNLLLQNSLLAFQKINIFVAGIFKKMNFYLTSRIGHDILCLAKYKNLIQIKQIICVIFKEWLS